MNRSRFEKSMALLLTGAVTLGFTGCMDFGGANKQAVVDAADQMASYMIELNADKLIKNSTLDKKSKEADKLSVLFSNDGRSDNDMAFINAVESTLDYEIDVDSLEIEKGEASIDIVFEIVDYASVFTDEYTNIDDLLAAVSKARTKEITFTAEFVKEEKEWIADNVAGKKFLQIYDYRNEEIELAFTPDMVAAMIDRKLSSFWLTTDGIYVDTDLIEYDYYFTDDIYAYADRGISIYCTLDKDGTEIYRMDPVNFGDSTNICCVLEAADIGAIAFDPGTYTVKLFMIGSKGDELVDSQSITVEEAKATPTPVPGNNGASEGAFKIMDSDFAKNIQKYGWLGTEDNFSYKDGAEKMVFTLLVNDDYSETLDYEFCYTNSFDEASLTDALTNPVYSGSTSPVDYDEGRFVDFTYAVDGGAAAGVYFVLIYEAGTDHVLAYAFCAVGL